MPGSRRKYGWIAMAGWKGKAGIWKSLLLAGISVTGLVISIACINTYTIFSQSGNGDVYSLESRVKGDEHYILWVEVKVISYGLRSHRNSHICHLATRRRHSFR